LTLEDLYNGIDWSAIDSQHDEKCKEWTEKLGIDPKSGNGVLNSGFVKKFRQTLLQEGLENPEKEKMMEARSLLTPIIWDQVITIVDFPD
jgi:hypothetical protein